MEHIFNEQQRLIDSIIPTKRYLYGRIDWSERCIGILGARGTGKTTLMLQHVKEAYFIGGKALYVSVDSPYSCLERFRVSPNGRRALLVEPPVFP